MNITQTTSNIHAVSRFTRVAAICLAFAGLVACGDDDKASTRSKDAFCAIEKQIDDEFNNAFAALGDNVTEEQAIATVVEVSGAVIERVGRDNYLSAAPAEITDAATLLWAAAERAAAGDAGAFDEPAASAAGEEMDTYCYGPAGP